MSERQSVNDYSTEELERLTALTEQTANQGEYLKSGRYSIVFRTWNGVVHASGSGRSYYINVLERRVRSFTDHTELDPPQDVMLAELARRRLTFRVGDLVMPRDPAAARWPGQGAHNVIRVSGGAEHDCFIQVGGGWTYRSEALRHATDAEVAAYHKAHCVVAPHVDASDFKRPWAHTKEEGLITPSCASRPGRLRAMTGGRL